MQNYSSQTLSIRSDTLNLFLTNAFARNQTLEERSQKIKHCAKAIQLRTKDSTLKLACKKLRKEKSPSLVVQAIDKAENQFHARKLEQQLMTF